MKLTKAVLRAAGIYNSYDLARRQPEPRVYLDYYPQWAGRYSTGAVWAICRDGQHIDSTRYPSWYSVVDKTFSVFGRSEKEPTLAVAQAWASAQYGIAEWEKSVYGSWHPAGTLALIAASIQAGKEATR